MNREFEIDFKVAAQSGDLAERILRFASKSDQSTTLNQLVDEAAALVDQAKPGEPRERWALWLAAARCSTAERALSEAVQSGVGVADAKARFDILRTALEEMAATVNRAEQPDGHVSLINQLLQEALPILYWARTRRWERFRKSPPEADASPSEELAQPLPTVARLIVHLNDAPLVSPQELRPATLYDVRLEAHFLALPERVASVEFRFTTTLASTQYSLSTLSQTRTTESGDGKYIVEAAGAIVFPYAQSDPFRPVVFAVSAFLVVGTERIPVRIIGQDQLHFRIRDPSRTLLSSGWPRMDAHVHELLQKLCDEQPTVRDELATLIPLLNGLTAVLGTFAQGAVLKGSTHVSEAEFQQEALKLLRMKLGEEVQEGPKQAGGVTDIRYRGAIVELKVEDSISDHQQLLAKYSSQATQYQGVESRSVATLLILDLTEKAEPAGDLRNDVLVGKVETHGGSGKYPSWAFLFVVRGNVKSPSTYSR